MKKIVSLMILAMVFGVSAETKSPATAKALEVLDAYLMNKPEKCYPLLHPDRQKITPKKEFLRGYEMMSQMMLLDLAIKSSIKDVYTMEAISENKLEDGIIEVIIDVNVPSDEARQLVSTELQKLAGKQRVTPVLLKKMLPKAVKNAGSGLKAMATVKRKMKVTILEGGKKLYYLDISAG